MSENKQVMDESREMMEELCGPSAAAVESAVEDEAAAIQEVAERTSAEALIELSREDRCTDCLHDHSASLLREVELRHEAEDVSAIHLAARDQALEAMDAVIRERDAALAERDARVADEALRAQRVDIEALRTKVELMKKNLIAVDARADERFDEALREKDRSCERRTAELLAAERASVSETVAKAAQDTVTLAAVREGESVRVKAINAAMEMIWATGRRDKGAPRNDRELVVALTQILSVGGIPKQ